MLAPVGCPAFRFNLMIAVCGATAAVLLGVAMRQLVTLAGLPQVGWPVILAAACGWGLSDTFWWQAVIGDKYAACYLGFVLLIVLSLTPGRKCLLTLGLGTGLAISAHYYAAFALPMVACSAWISGPPRLAGADERRKGLRGVILCLILAALPLSTRLLYPPIRAAARPQMNWGNPSTFDVLAGTLAARRYHGAAAESALASRPGLLTERLTMFRRTVSAELPLALLLGLPIGAYILFERIPVVLLGLAGTIAFNLIYALNFTEKVERWYVPLYAPLILVALVGWIALMRRRAQLLAILAVALLGWQLLVGLPRNALSRFYAAHDLGRNILVSLPHDSVYLGASDIDMFPLWEMKSVEHERDDLEVADLAIFVDAHPANSAGIDHLSRRFGPLWQGPRGLRAIMVHPSRPVVMVAKSGYPAELMRRLEDVLKERAMGLTALVVPAWDPEGSRRETERVLRAYVWRGLLCDRVGALFSPERGRDEIARDALLSYANSLGSIGVMCAYFHRTDEALWAYERSRKLMEPIVGSLPIPSGLTTSALRLDAERSAVVSGCLRLAAAMEARGIVHEAATLRASAAFFGP